MDRDFLLKIAQILATLLTPIIVTVLGVVIVRRIEGIKAEATKRSAFHVRWADEFFDACQQFLRALEREIAILTFLTHRADRNDEDGMKMQRDQGEVHFLAYELQLRIRRCAGFAPQNQDRISKLAKGSFSLVNNLVADRQGNLDPIFQILNDFNNCARQAHAEILALDRLDHHEGRAKLTLPRNS
ncbi:MAG: hypothetical protein P4L71_15105 [Acetobacteraceae bacterium]|nr:hypothetical protein [Acetobacteraceae bacterium]